MKMLEKNNEHISEDEAALYDRQIRLWGLDAQKRLRGSRVLIAGLCGVGAEVTKNLVLSGIKSLTLLDSRAVTEIDTYSNFLVPHDAIGENIAKASLERAQALNPIVDVSVDCSKVEEKDEEFFKQFDVVCICRGSRDHLLKINQICRQNNIQFFAGDVYGMIGYTFTDLLEHDFVEEVKEKVQVEVNGVKQSSEDIVMVKKKDSFVSLSKALEVDWTSKRYLSRLQKTSEVYFIMHVMFEFVTLHGRLPIPNNREEEQVELLTIKNALMDKMNVPREKVSKDFAGLVFGQLSPVCAIVGGMLAQEIIKSVSQKDPPNNNFFFFSVKDEAGVVECIGI